jgi:hypothetical protein
MTLPQDRALIDHIDFVVGTMNIGARARWMKRFKRRKTPWVGIKETLIYLCLSQHWSAEQALNDLRAKMTSGELPHQWLD